MPQRIRNTFWGLHKSEKVKQMGFFFEEFYIMFGIILGFVFGSSFFFLFGILFELFVGFFLKFFVVLFFRKSLRYVINGYSQVPNKRVYSLNYLMLSC